jgi:uncharacterized membrane protein YecN with MAPEG domain
MIHLPVTLATASILGIFYLVLSAAVSGERNRSKTGLGTGPEPNVALGAEHKAPPLFVAVRRHGNFAEYVPLSLILIMLLELNGVPRPWLLGLAGALVLARLMQAAGMGMAAPNLPRAGGSTIQWLMILTASVYGLALTVMHWS